MLDPDPSVDIVVIVDKPCWKDPTSQWEALIRPAVLEALCQSRWIHGAEINVLLTDDAAIRELNKSHLGHDKPTNVLSFPSLEPEAVAGLLHKDNEQVPVILEGVVLGDVVLAFETLQQESLAQKKSFEHHVLHLTVHGILHLLGFDHEQDKDALVMESLEIKILSSLTIPNPY